MSLKEVNNFFNKNEYKLNKITLGVKYHAYGSVIFSFILLYLLFRDGPLVMSIAMKVASFILFIASSLAINIALSKYFTSIYKKWYQSESKKLIEDTLIETWDSQKYDTLRYVLNKFPLKTLYIMFIEQGHVNWSKPELKYKNLDETLVFLQSNPCDFKDLDSSEYTYKYIQSVMPELSEHVAFEE